MPLVVHYFKAVKTGSVCSDIVCNMDFAPTLLNFADVVTRRLIAGQDVSLKFTGQFPRRFGSAGLSPLLDVCYNDTEHEAYAHYGVRNHQYELIY